MNIYEKLAAARVKLSAGGLKKGGSNAHTGRVYFELSDFLPALTRIQNELQFVCIPSFGTDLATMTIVNTEDPADRVEITTPMSTAELKGVHAVQNLGAVQTYLRRYLYMAAFEIVETDALDGAEPQDAKPASRKSGGETRENPVTPPAQQPDWVDRAKAAGLSPLITAAQKAALIALCDGKTEVLTEIRQNMGYAKTSDIRKEDYSEVERRLKVALEGKA